MHNSLVPSQLFSSARPKGRLLAIFTRMLHRAVESCRPVPSINTWRRVNDINDTDGLAHRGILPDTKFLEVAYFKTRRSLQQH